MNGRDARNHCRKPGLGANRPAPAKAATGALLIEIKDKLTVRVKIDS